MNNSSYSVGSAEIIMISLSLTHSRSYSSKSCVFQAVAAVYCMLAQLLSLSSSLPLILSELCLSVAIILQSLLSYLKPAVSVPVHCCFSISKLYCH